VSAGLGHLLDQPTSGIELRAPFQWRRQQGVLWIDAQLGAARAAFTTRLGGSSGGPYESLNLGILTDDEPALVAQNRRVLASAVARDPAGFAMGLQVHGADLQVHETRPRATPYVERGLQMTEADAQLTGHAEVTPIVLVADCLPVVLAAPGAAGVLHCGWRGVAGSLVPRAVNAIAGLAGVSSGELSASLGPGIRSCCYAVGEEVLSAFRTRGHDEPIVGADRLDLALAVRSELEWAGVKGDRIFDVALCTSCHPRLFFSHRRDGGVTGRQAGLAWLE
jgi:YfiH family protein